MATTHQTVKWHLERKKEKRKLQISKRVTAFRKYSKQITIMRKKKINERAFYLQFLSWFINQFCTIKCRQSTMSNMSARVCVSNPVNNQESSLRTSLCFLSILSGSTCARKCLLCSLYLQPTRDPIVTKAHCSGQGEIKGTGVRYGSVKLPYCSAEEAILSFHQGLIWKFANSGYKNNLHQSQRHSEIKYNSVGCINIGPAFGKEAGFEIEKVKSASGTIW